MLYPVHMVGLRVTMKEAHRLYRKYIDSILLLKEKCINSNYFGTENKEFGDFLKSRMITIIDDCIISGNGVSYSCGFCGAPISASGDTIGPPFGYDPDDYKHDVCPSCAESQYMEK